MGYSYRNGGLIKDYWPDDTEDTIYITGIISIAEVIEKATAKFGNMDLSKLLVMTDNIHTSCLTYDLYDSSDYTLFTIIQYQLEG